MPQRDLNKFKHWEKISIDTAEFILAQSEKTLADVSQAIDAFTNRALSVLQFTMAGIPLLLGYYFAGKPVHPLQELTIAGIAILIVISLMAFKIYNTYRIVPQGNEPKK